MQSSTSCLAHAERSNRAKSRFRTTCLHYQIVSTLQIYNIWKPRAHYVRRLTARFRTELLESYILGVHPQVPVLDLEPFLRALSENDGSDTISLLFFHVVMFAGAAFVDISYINQEGYTSRAAARDILFQRSKVGPPFSS
jgi:hypothetical protein